MTNGAHSTTITTNPMKLPMTGINAMIFGIIPKINPIIVMIRRAKIGIVLIKHT